MTMFANRLDVFDRQPAHLKTDDWLDDLEIQDARQLTDPTTAAANRGLSPKTA
jgi:hypothetical protein